MSGLVGGFWILWHKELYQLPSWLQDLKMSPFARFTSWYWQLANALRSGIGELVIVQGIFKGSIVLNRDQIIAGMYHSSSRTRDSKGGG